jgi:hypothetical protein
VRLRIAGGEVRPRFVAEPDAGDEVVEVGELRVFVAAPIVEQFGGDIVVDVTPEHGTLVVKKAK